MYHSLSIILGSSVANCHSVLEYGRKGVHRNKGNDIPPSRSPTAHRAKLQNMDKRLVTFHWSRRFSIFMDMGLEGHWHLPPPPKTVTHSTGTPPPTCIFPSAFQSFQAYL
jgi:hypothetical protein